MCRSSISEVDRFEWRRGQPDDPAVSLADFLSAYGLLAADLTRPRAGGGGATPCGAAVPGGVCGAAVLFSAEAGAELIRAPTAPPPVPGVPDVVAVVYAHRDPPAVPAAVRVPRGRADERWRVGEWTSSWSPRRHAEAVRRVRAAIGRGDVYQVNVVGHASAPFVGDPLPALRRVAGLSGATYGGVLSGAGWAVACASPETLVEVRDGVARTRPIKGTRPATSRGRAELLASDKERAEHIMIVDLERNDLARVARTGSVRVERLYALRHWSGLWQAESDIAADLAPGTGLADLLAAVLPGGSVTGAPKLAALDLIAALEPIGRGPSMAALGWVAPGWLDLGLSIRTVAVAAGRVHLWAGGGITWGSDPAAEVAEADAKAAPIRAAFTA